MAVFPWGPRRQQVLTAPPALVVSWEGATRRAAHSPRRHSPSSRGGASYPRLAAATALSPRFPSLPPRPPPAQCRGPRPPVTSATPRLQPRPRPRAAARGRRQERGARALARGAPGAGARLGLAPPTWPARAAEGRPAHVTATPRPDAPPWEPAATSVLAVLCGGRAVASAGFGVVRRLQLSWIC